MDGKYSDNYLEVERQLTNLEKTLDEHRVKLDEEVFIERHLPTIAKYGKPTEELQRELILVAGGENKRIILVNDKLEKVLVLPSAVSSGETLDFRSLGFTKSKQLSEMTDKLDERTQLRNDKAIDDIVDDTDKLATKWDYVIEHYKDRIEKKEEKSKLTLEQTKEESDEYDYE